MKKIKNFHIFIKKNISVEKKNKFFVEKKINFTYLKFY